MSLREEKKKELQEWLQRIPKRPLLTLAEVRKRLPEEFHNKFDEEFKTAEKSNFLLVGVVSSARIQIASKFIILFFILFLSMTISSSILAIFDIIYSTSDIFVVIGYSCILAISTIILVGLYKAIQPPQTPAYVLYTTNELIRFSNIKGQVEISRQSTSKLMTKNIEFIIPEFNSYNLSQLIDHFAVTSTLIQYPNKHMMEMPRMENRSKSIARFCISEKVEEDLSHLLYISPNYTTSYRSVSLIKNIFYLLGIITVIILFVCAGITLNSYFEVGGSPFSLNAVITIVLVGLITMPYIHFTTKLISNAYTITFHDILSRSSDQFV